MKMHPYKIIIRTALILFSFCLSPENFVIAQVHVVRSTEMVVVRGGKFYIHTVAKGETAFSIARTYGITVEELHRQNSDALHGLREGQVLKLPVMSEESERDKEVEKPAMEKDNSRFNYHTIVAGETIFALSRKYDVSQTSILEANPGLDPADIPLGMEIAIPKKDIKFEEISIAPQEPEITLYMVTQGETMASISRKFGVSTRDLRRENRGMIFPKAGEMMRIPGRHILEDKDSELLVETDSIPDPAHYDTIPYIEIRADYSDISSLKGSVDIGVMLPLFLQENSVRVDIDTLLPASRRVQERPFHWIYPRTISFLEMYEGILVAADELRDAGMDVRIHAFDTRADAEVVDQIVNSGRLRNLDIIIGPVYSFNLERVADYAGRYNIPIVSPVPLRDNSLLEDNPSLFIVNPSLETTQEKLARSISEHYESNLVFIYSDTATVNNESMAFRNMLMRELSYKTQIEEVNFKQVLFRSRSVTPNDTLNRLSHALNPAMTNVVILATENESAISETIMNLHSLLRWNKMIVFGYPMVRSLENNIELNYLFDLGINIYAPFRVDYYDENVNRFLSTYRSKFGTEPPETSFAWVGYDITTYFASGLALHGRRFTFNPGMHNPKLLQTKFDFRRESRNYGFENRGLFRLKYTDGMKLVVVEEPHVNSEFRY